MFLSIMGMYEFDPSVFDGLELPTFTDKGITHVIDKNALINNILLNCAELELVYPDIQTMKLAIGVWSAAEFRTWEKLYATTLLAYNPIWNVDADVTDVITGSENRDISRSSTGSNNRTINTSDNETVNLSDNRTANLADNRTANLADNESIDITDTESVKGFNSNTWAESKKSVKSGTDNISHTGTDNITHTGTDNISHTGTDNTTHKGTDNVALSASENVGDDVQRSETHTQRRTGNIGVVSTQSMIEQERSIAEFSIINYITQAFKARFCLMIY